MDLKIKKEIIGEIQVKIINMRNIAELRVRWPPVHVIGYFDLVCLLTY